MIFKVNTQVMFTPTILRILEVWTQACQEMISMVYEPTCTGGLDGIHSEHSGHYSARSLDFRSKDIDYHLREPLKHRAQSLLGPDYLVLLEDDHYHIQANRSAKIPDLRKSIEV